MVNVTLAFDELTLQGGCERAGSMGLSLNAYIQRLIQRDTQCDGSWLDELFAWMDANPLSAQGVTWTRDGIHKRREG